MCAYKNNKITYQYLFHILSMINWKYYIDWMIKKKIK